MMGIALAAVVLGLMLYNGNRETGLSVHDLDWSDYAGMNENISTMTFHIPPHFMNENIESHLDLTDIFHLFSENQQLLRDRPEIRSQTLDSDFEVVLEFTNLTGEEAFLNDKWAQETLNISFYVERSLAQTSLDLRGKAVRAYYNAQNPCAFSEVISLDEINWSDLLEGYETYIEEISISRFYWRMHTEDFEFISGEDDLINLLHFFRDNNEGLIDGIIDIEAITAELFETGDIKAPTEYMVWIIFRLSDAEENEACARPHAAFHMSQALGEQLVEIIGEEAWEQARRQ